APRSKRCAALGMRAGRAVERARGGGAQAGDCAVIALLALYLVTTLTSPASTSWLSSGLRFLHVADMDEDPVVGAGSVRGRLRSKAFFPLEPGFRTRRRW